VADLQARAEKVAQLEKERTRFMERETHFTEATEKIRQRLEEAEKKVKFFEEENMKLRLSANTQEAPNKPRATTNRNTTSKIKEN
jgi:predicted nuclease with TOPRIM domain